MINGTRSIAGSRLSQGSSQIENEGKYDGNIYLDLRNLKILIQSE